MEINSSFQLTLDHFIKALECAREARLAAIRARGYADFAQRNAEICQKFSNDMKNLGRMEYVSQRSSLFL